MPPRRLLKLAEQMERLAEKLDGLESHQFMRSLLPRSSEDRLNFKQLPEILRKRAILMKIDVLVNTKTFSLIHRGLMGQARISLIELVRQSTKNRSMYFEVALLLTAGLEAIGIDGTVTPGSLRTLCNSD